jgi:hypothetical protein
VATRAAFFNSNECSPAGGVLDFPPSPRQSRKCPRLSAFLQFWVSVVPSFPSFRRPNLLISYLNKGNEILPPRCLRSARGRRFARDDVLRSSDVGPRSQALNHLNCLEHRKHFLVRLEDLPHDAQYYRQHSEDGQLTTTLTESMHATRSHWPTVFSR